ncbi:MAG TPA: TldD/PmbA family protein [Acidimicrobiales bacterium]|nr:TldD/PmbA family protein [Acidimicrobiales bacterium]
MSDVVDLARRVAGGARAGEQIEAFVVRSTSTAVRVHGGEVESLTSAASAGVGVRVVTADRRQGFAWGASLDDDVVREATRDARDNAAFGQPADWNGLAEPDGVAPAELDLDRPGLAALSTDAKVRLALELERAVLAGDARIKGVRTASWGDGRSERAIATSTGLEAWGRSGSCSLSVLALATDGSETRTAGGSATEREPGDLDLASIAGEAVRKSTRLLGARPMATGRVTVVFEPEVTASFLGIVGSLLSGMAVLKGRSLFAGRLGDAVAAPAVTLVDDPTDPESLGGLAHDGEGLASRRNVLVDRGQLRTFVYDSTTARRAGGEVRSTGSAVRSYRTTPSPSTRALSVLPGPTGTQEALLAAVGDGVLVQSLRGLNSGVNRVSGDFSVGADGLRIRDGELAEPVSGVTVASTLPRMLLGVVAVGGDVQRRGGALAPSLAVADIALGGTSARR